MKSVAVSLLLLVSAAYAADLEEIWKPAADGFVDLTLTIQSVEQAPEGYTTVTARGLDRRTIVGLKVSFKNGMQPGFIGSAVDRTAFKEDGIVYSSIGPESDALLGAMASLYRVDAPGRFAERVGAVSIALLGNPSNLLSEPVKFKVFFNPDGGESSYAELYTNIDLPGKKLELFEKDMSYRTSVVRALAGKR
jgi:hypothetical protein